MAGVLLGTSFAALPSTAPVEKGAVVQVGRST